MRAAKANQNITEACNRISALKVVIAGDFILFYILYWSFRSCTGTAKVRGRIRWDIAATSAVFNGFFVDMLEICISVQFPVTAQIHLF